MDFEAPPTDPMPQCQLWFDEARQKCTVPNTHAMALSTVDAQGRPSCRMVLLKGFDARGPVFYTNSESRKGDELAGNPNVSLLFFWDELERQIRIEGLVELVSADEADAYFASRPRGSQIGAWASDQSRAGATAAGMNERVAAFESQFDGQEVPRPRHWLGYRVVPRSIEFWQGGAYRLHQRVVYELDERGEWKTQRLWP
ncbi:MAG: pyridoxamine 5'-phosphate oxidase [Phycisphaerales bacterium]|nr:pyridoxamine 5'-phosphate oxidase [Phycisphaerales bacterium]